MAEKKLYHGRGRNATCESEKKRGRELFPPRGKKPDPFIAL